MLKAAPMSRRRHTCVYPGLGAEVYVAFTAPPAMEFVDARRLCEAFSLFGRDEGFADESEVGETNPAAKHNPSGRHWKPPFLHPEVIVRPQA